MAGDGDVAGGSVEPAAVEEASGQAGAVAEAEAVALEVEDGAPGGVGRGERAAPLAEEAAALDEGFDRVGDDGGAAQVERVERVDAEDGLVLQQGQAVDVDLASAADGERVAEQFKAQQVGAVVADEPGAAVGEVDMPAAVVLDGGSGLIVIGDEPPDIVVALERGGAVVGVAAAAGEIPGAGEEFDAAVVDQLAGDGDVAGGSVEPAAVDKISTSRNTPSVAKKHFAPYDERICQHCYHAPRPEKQSGAFGH